jgi:hypothetical protein
MFTNEDDNLSSAITADWHVSCMGTASAPSRFGPDDRRLRLCHHDQSAARRLADGRRRIVAVYTEPMSFANAGVRSGAVTLRVQ